MMTFSVYIAHYGVPWAMYSFSADNPLATQRDDKVAVDIVV